MTTSFFPPISSTPPNTHPMPSNTPRISTAGVSLPGGTGDTEIDRKVSEMEDKIRRLRPTNQTKKEYFLGKNPLINLGIAVPENMVGVMPALGWPSTVVDVIAERIDFLRYSSPDDSAEVLNEAMRISKLRTEYSKAVTDSLVYGIGFLEITRHDQQGDELGRPRVTAVDPTMASFEWDHYGDKPSFGLVCRKGDDGILYRTIYLPDRTLTEQKVMREDGTPTTEFKEYNHNRGIPGLVPIPNQLDSGRSWGHSEITPAVVYATDHGLRTMLGMEYNREIYTTPQRWATNVKPELLGLSPKNSPEANRNAGWRASMANHVAIPPQVDPETLQPVEPKMGQFASSPPTPYIQELRMLTQIIAAEASIPVQYLGFITDNPSTEGAIRQSEYRLVKKVELKQRQHSQILLDLIAPLLWWIIFDQDIPREIHRELDTVFQAASTPTQASLGDYAVKLVAAGVIPKNSSVLYDMLGLTPEQQRRLEVDRAKEASLGLVGDLAALANEARNRDALTNQLANQNVPDQSVQADESTQAEREAAGGGVARVNEEADWS